MHPAQFCVATGQGAALCRSPVAPIAQIEAHVGEDFTPSPGISSRPLVASLLVALGAMLEGTHSWTRGQPGMRKQRVRGRARRTRMRTYSRLFCWVRVLPHICWCRFLQSAFLVPLRVLRQGAVLWVLGLRSRWIQNFSEAHLRIVCLRVQGGAREDETLKEMFEDTLRVQAQPCRHRQQEHQRSSVAGVAMWRARRTVFLAFVASFCPAFVPQWQLAGCPVAMCLRQPQGVRLRNQVPSLPSLRA